MMNGTINHFRFRSLTLLFMVIFVMTGCRYLSIPAKDDAAPRQINSPKGSTSPIYNSTVIKGRIVSSDPAADWTLILAYRLYSEKNEYTEYAVTKGHGAFMLYLPQGRYQLFAITDYNHDGVFENNEVSGLYGSAREPVEISLSEGELLRNVVIRTARANRTKIILPLEWQQKKDRDLIRQVTQNGQVLKIYHEHFSWENAQTGYWNPSSFMKAYGAHIYQTQPYAPGKIPILFVHGTEGTPYNWIYFYMRLDQSRYQPWFFYYPSGIRLPLAAALLEEELQELRQKYGFRKMAIVAHSVGGLTTRSFLARRSARDKDDFVKLFVSLATPWSGFGAADASQVIVHKSIPSWVDMGKQSVFINSSLGEKLPGHVKHYIFYGKNDKICGDKALDERAVRSAVKTLEFECTHDTILSDRKVFAEFKTILEKELK